MALTDASTSPDDDCCPDSIGLLLDTVPALNNEALSDVEPGGLMIRVG
jgi:hypothetical protein